ncbi:MAG TPA: secretin N-terminal domain-containing protein [Pyrinomonadaceae bacterium]|nr:secretin N-terminal domain-containing protein [Pyrinomonadaceae bacterium]
MIKHMKNAVTAFALVLIINATSFAQTPSPAAQTRPEDNYVTEKGFKSKVFTVTYRDVNQLSSVLRPLLSGFKGATISSNGEFKTLTVRDFPENIATIEEAIKRLDLPTAARPNIELHIHILVGSNSGVSTEQPPAELKDVIAQLRGTLTYKNYELAASVVQRLTETPRGLRGTGAAQISNSTPGGPSVGLPYEYFINQVSWVSNPAGAATIHIAEFTFGTVSDKERVQVQTALNLRDGEKVVVGTATIRDRALIVVLTAKVLN